jgi:hypothetical protein
MGRADDFGSIQFAPLGMRVVSGFALISHVDPFGLDPDPEQGWVGLRPGREGGTTCFSHPAEELLE